MAQVPAELQRFCNMFDAYRTEMAALTAARVAAENQSSARLNPFEVKERGQRIRAAREAEAAREKVFLDVAATYFAPDGAIAGMTGKLARFGDRHPGLIPLELESECTGPSGKPIPISLKAVDETRNFVNEASFSGLTERAPILSFMRNLHEGDAVRFSGRFVRHSNRLIAAPEPWTLRSSLPGVYGYIVLTSIEAIATAAPSVKPAPAPATVPPAPPEAAPARPQVQTIEGVFRVRLTEPMVSVRQPAKGVVESVVSLSGARMTGMDGAEVQLGGDIRGTDSGMVPVVMIRALTLPGKTVKVRRKADGPVCKGLPPPAAPQSTRSPSGLATGSTVPGINIPAATVLTCQQELTIVPN